jgi:hypothetical protein
VAKLATFRAVAADGSTDLDAEWDVSGPAPDVRTIGRIGVFTAASPGSYTILAAVSVDGRPRLLKALVVVTGSIPVPPPVPPPTPTPTPVPPDPVPPPAPVTAPLDLVVVYRASDANWRVEQINTDPSVVAFAETNKARVFALEITSEAFKQWWPDSKPALEVPAVVVIDRTTGRVLSQAPAVDATTTLETLRRLRGQ